MTPLVAHAAMRIASPLRFLWEAPWLERLHSGIERAERFFAESTDNAGPLLRV